MRHRQGLRQIAPGHAEPAVLGPFDGIEQALAAERPVAVLEAVVERVPALVRPLYQRGMAARPPGFGLVLRADQRVAGVLLPRSVDRAGAGGDHHVAGGRTCRAAYGGEHVEPVAMVVDLGAFGRKALDVPILGIVPGIVDMLDLAGQREAVLRQAHPVSARKEQPA